MARSDLLISLVKASISGNVNLIRSTVEAMIAEEKAKQHHVLAERLDKILSSSGANGVFSIASHAKSAHGGREFLAELRPQRRLEDLILPEMAVLVCNQLIEEQRRSDLLRAHGLEPRHRALFVGPPGNGKTSLAEALAEALALPFFIVRYELMIGSYLGETAARLKRMFDYARTTPCVLFFDEFDALGKERGDTNETGEIKRVVSSLLMQIDELPSYTVVIAATNHAELLDRAVWRRFEVRIELPKPNIKALTDYVNRFLQRLDQHAGMSAKSVAERLGSVSYSEAEQFHLNILRRKALSTEEISLKTLLLQELNAWEARVVGSEMTNSELQPAQ